MNGKWTFSNGVDKSAVAYGTISVAINETGWNILKVKSNEEFSNEDQSYAAGLIEGYLSQDMIYTHSKNIYGEKQPSKHIQSILDENAAWEKEESKKGDRLYWEHRHYLDLQIDGLYDGYMIANEGKPERALSKWQIQYANYDGDVGDWNSLPHNDTSEHPAPTDMDRLDHCSALLRITPDKQDLIVGQSTWSALHTMYKMHKIYDIPLRGPSGVIPGHLQSFSTYPARISSGDDYYTVGEWMVVQETTIGNYNDDLLKYVNGKAVMQWARNLIANRLARSPREWCKLYAEYNNGCYNNQWMVLDYRFFTPGKGLSEGGFYILEQIPGYVEYYDMTTELNERGYYGSYNIAYNEKVYELSGAIDLFEKYGDDYSYAKCPRARIFARDVPRVHDESSFRAMLRYNDFKHDPLSQCSGYPGYTGSYAIGCRNDLNLANGTYPRPGLGQRNHAATDGKITSLRLMKAGVSSQIIAGPPYRDVGVFAWETSAFKDLPHWGLPERYEFPWIEVDKDGNFKVVSFEYDDKVWYVCLQTVY